MSPCPNSSRPYAFKFILVWQCNSEFSEHRKQAAERAAQERLGMRKRAAVHRACTCAAREAARARRLRPLGAVVIHTGTVLEGRGRGRTRAGEIEAAPEAVRGVQCGACGVGGGGRGGARVAERAAHVRRAAQRRAACRRRASACQRRVRHTRVRCLRAVLGDHCT